MSGNNASVNILRNIALFLLFPFLGIAQDVDSLVTAAVAKSEILRKEEGNIVAAIATLEGILEQLEREGNHPKLSLVPLYHKLGVNYYRFGDHAEAVKYVRRALMIREQAYGKVHIDVARGYYLRAILNKELQLYDDALHDLNQAISSMETLLESKLSTETFRLIWMFEECVRLHSALRNNTLALQYWDRIYDHFAVDKKENYSQLINLYHNKGTIYYNQQKYELAEQAYLSAIQLFVDNNQPDTELQAMAIAYSDLGLMQYNLGKYQRAETSYNTALQYFEQSLGDSKTPLFYQKTGVVYSNLMELAGQTEDFQQVGNYFDKALENLRKGCGTFFHPLIATLHLDKAQIRIKQQNLAEALAFNQKSLHALVPDFADKNPLDLVDLNENTITDKISFLATLRQKAEILSAIFQENQEPIYLQAAFQNYQTLDTVITQIRQSYNAAGSQFDLIEQSYPIYGRAINTALTLYEQTQEKKYLSAAYHFAAKNKALVLLGGRQEEQAMSFSSIPEELKEEERSLKKAIFQLEAAIYDQAETDRHELQKDSLFTLRRSYQKLIDRFEEEYTDYFALKYGFDQQLSIPGLQQRLAKGACVVEYFISEESIFVFTISKTTFDYTRIDLPNDLNQKVYSFRGKLESQSPADQDFLALGHELFNVLLDVPLTKISDHTTIDHLVIIPDGLLLQLPFDVLIVEPNSSLPHYLIKDYAISYAYSNQLLFGPENQPRAQQLFGGFGLEYDDYTLAGLTPYADNTGANQPQSRALGKLQYSDEEVQEIADLLTGQIWLNEKATREAFLTNAERFSILHLATHGLLNEEYPMNSALVFTRQNDSTDYLLRAADLYSLQLQSEMVVLSACNTGAGTLHTGEGVRSLARAFAAAGCPSLVASLWNASDKSTKDIIVEFYRNLQMGMTKAEALRQAKLEYLKTAPPAYQSPYYWSHLSVIGDSKALQALQKSFWQQWWFWGIAALLALAGLLVSLQYRRA